MKLNPKFLAKKKGMKKVKEAGTPTKILFANVIVFSKSLCSKYEKAIVIILTNGRAIINPAKTGFLKESQLANEIIKAEKKILAKKITIY